MKLPEKCIVTYDENDVSSPLGKLIESVPAERWVRGPLGRSPLRAAPVRA